MPKCVSCGAQAEDGEIFCPRCLASLSTGRDSRPEETAAVELTPTGEEESPPPAALTPPEKKKVIRRGEQAKKAYESAAASALGGTKDKKERLATPSTKASGGGAVSEALAGVGKTAGGLALRLARRIASSALRSWGWSKRMAMLERAAYDVVDWAAAGIGIISSALLMVFFALFDLMRFEWVFSEQSSPLAQKVALKGMELGALGYLLLSLAGVAIVFLALDALFQGRGKRLRINAAFFAALAVVLCVLVLLICLLSDGVLIRYAGKKYQGDASFFRDADKEEKIGWAGRRTLGGAYLSLMMLVTAFSSAGALLAESRELPAWVGAIIYRIKRGRGGARSGHGPDA